MKRAILALLTLSLVAPVWADKRLDDAVSKALDQIQKGKPDDAIKTMQKAASQANTPEAWLAFARIQRAVGQRDEAAESTRKAVEVASAPADKATALAGLSALALNEGSGKDALQHAQQAVAAQETPTSLAALARAQARNEDVPAALATIAKAMQAGGALPGVHEAHGDVLLAAGKGAEAADAYRKALAADANLVTARAGLAAALVAQGKAAEAVKEARAAVAADENSAEAHAVLGTALLAENVNQWNDAIASAQQAVFLNPKSVMAQVAVARIFEVQGNLAQATKAYESALAVDPSYVPAQVGLVEGLARQGKNDEALAAAQKILAASPNSGRANYIAGTILARKGQWTQAADHLEKAVAGGVNSAEAWAAVGTARQYVRKSAEAVEAYKKAVELDPKNAGYRTTYGLLLGIAGREAEGIAELQKVVADPGYKDADAWINLGWLYRSSDPINAAESVKAYQKALSIDPENTQAMLGLGWAQYYNKNYPAAVEAFTKTAQADETLASGAYSGAGWSHLFNKDLAKAKEFAAKAAAAGRADAKLVEQIAAVEAGREAQQRAIERAKEAADAMAAAQPAASTVDDFTQLLLYGDSAQTKIRAARQLPKFGAAGLDPLISAIVRESNISVRKAIAQAIGSYGPAGRKADVHLRQLLENLKCGEVIPSAACLEKERKNEELIQAVTSAIRALHGR